MPRKFKGPTVLPTKAKCSVCKEPTALHPGERKAICTSCLVSAAQDFVAVANDQLSLRGTLWAGGRVNQL